MKVIARKMETKAKKKKQVKMVQANDEITSEVLQMGGLVIIKYLTKGNEILETGGNSRQCWRKAKVIIRYKTGDAREIRKYNPISFLSQEYKILTRPRQKTNVRILDNN